eukprot:149891-Pleurochrysis_carterae.AAC.1
MQAFSRMYESTYPTERRRVRAATSTAFVRSNTTACGTLPCSVTWIFSTGWGRGGWGTERVVVRVGSDRNATRNVASRSAVIMSMREDWWLWRAYSGLRASENTHTHTHTHSNL